MFDRHPEHMDTASGGPRIGEWPERLLAECVEVTRASWPGWEPQRQRPDQHFAAPLAAGADWRGGGPLAPVLVEPEALLPEPGVGSWQTAEHLLSPKGSG